MVQETHEQELKDLFNQLPDLIYNGQPSVVNGEPIKMITYPLLVSISETLMAKAYYYGKIETVSDVENIMLSSFK